MLRIFGAQALRPYKIIFLFVQANPEDADFCQI